MPIGFFKQLEAPASVAIGAAVNADRLADKTVQIIGTFVADLDIEGSLDPAGTVFGVIATVSAPGLTQIPGTFRKLRINTTAFTSGVPQAFLGARDDRTR